MLLHDLTALVTGAGSGLGRAIALAYAREGARVVLSDITEEGARETMRLAAEATPRAECIFVRADASDPAAHEALVQAAVDRFGALHVACNNAGIGGELNPVGDLSVAGWRKVIEVNLSGVFYAMHAQIPRMLAAGGGAIVNMSSVLGQVGTSGVAGYAAAKHGVVGLTQTAAIDYAARGIRINAVGPGYIDTPLLGSLPAAARDGLVALHPIGRLGRAEEVAELVVWLSSDRASFVTGAYYPIDGGYLAR
ncbi:MAG TPA: glucose 1-dehydrogenase [Candidatus Limnocylindria bacterium]|jgi:NAD(P)-dependent dehydrogenase (short-subunit alcohol dehydrogenase family)|nr:glucose 1-dehydrogenase [Candidatus Limnocylindria bacterium]